MERINFTGKAARKVAGGLLLLATIMLTACNGASGDGAGSTGTGTGQGGTNASGPVSISVGLSPNSSVSLGAQTTATATLLDSKKQPIADALVTFTTDSKQATMVPSSGKVLTNASGQAVISLTAASVDANGAGSLQVDAAGTSGGSSFTATSAANYTIGSTNISLEPITLGQTTIDAYATTAIKVKVLINGVAATTPQTVTFTSGCATSGKAKLDATALTIAGEASATYTDNGCTGSDTITASLNIGSTAPRSATLNINPRKSSSLKFISTAPADGVITLKGFGAAARPETAQIVFQLVDANNNGIQGKAVVFSLDVSVGGVVLQSTSSITDIDGKAIAIVLAGNQPTPVRVTAKSDNLSSQSNGLSISTGFPDMDSVSLSANRYNINGGERDGATATITLRMADHFNNPIPDGTAVTFISDGGVIGAGNTENAGQCSTKNSLCTINLTSQNTRPKDGRVHVVAYAIGEESFVDKNNNIVADQDNELVDINNTPSDSGEAFVDKNENGVFDTGIDQLVDFNGNHKYDGPDGLFNGALCSNSYAKCSATKKSLHVFAQATFIFSSDKTPKLNTIATESSPKGLNALTLPTAKIRRIVLQCDETQAETLWIREVIAENAMATGTTVTPYTKDAGSISSSTPAPIVSNNLFSGNQADGTIFSVKLKADKCSTMKEDSNRGTWGVTVAIPDHGGGTNGPHEFSNDFCVYNIGKASACN